MFRASTVKLRLLRLSATKFEGPSELPLFSLFRSHHLRRCDILSGQDQDLEGRVYLAATMSVSASRCSARLVRGFTRRLVRKTGKHAGGPFDARTAAAGEGRRYAERRRPR